MVSIQKRGTRIGLYQCEMDNFNALFNMKWSTLVILLFVWFIHLMKSTRGLLTYCFGLPNKVGSSNGQLKWSLQKCQKQCMCKVIGMEQILCGEKLPSHKHGFRLLIRWHGLLPCVIFSYSWIFNLLRQIQLKDYNEFWFKVENELNINVLWIILWLPSKIELDFEVRSIELNENYKAI